MAALTGAASDAHFTWRLPPSFDAEHEPVQVTVQVAPDPHVTVVPAPAVTAQSLFGAHSTVADAPADNVHVACDWQARFVLSPAATEQLLCVPHVVLHDDPQAPVHVVDPVQENEQPLVCEAHAPLPLRLQAPPPAHVHVVPVQLAGALVLLALDEPQALDDKAKRKSKDDTIRFMNGS